MPETPYRHNNINHLVQPVLISTTNFHVQMRTRTDRNVHGLPLHYGYAKSICLFRYKEFRFNIVTTPGFFVGCFHLLKSSKSIC